MNCEGCDDDSGGNGWAGFCIEIRLHHAVFTNILYISRTSAVTTLLSGPQFDSQTMLLVYAQQCQGDNWCLLCMIYFRVAAERFVIIRQNAFLPKWRICRCCSSMRRDSFTKSPGGDHCESTVPLKDGDRLLVLILVHQNTSLKL